MSAVLLPDRTARKLWDRVADAADRVDNIVDGIARVTVAGKQTRSSRKRPIFSSRPKLS